MIARDQLPAAKLPEEIVEVPGLGGSVLVRGLRLAEALTVAEKLAAGPSGMCDLLSRTVLLEDGLPAYMPDEWDTFGGTHRDECLALLAVALRLSGSTRRTRKKSTEPA